MADEYVYEDEYGNTVNGGPQGQPQQMPPQMPGYMPYGDSGLYDAMAMQEIQNSRQFYLSYEELLDDFEHFWKGENKTEKGWTNEFKGKTDDPAIMSEKAARVLVNLLRGALSKVIRLTNFKMEDINRLSYQSRERIAGWLATEGWLKYNIPVSYLPMISHQCELLTYSSLLWAKEGGGQRFMNTSVRSVENTSQVFQQSQERDMGRGGQMSRKIPKMKLF